MNLIERLRRDTFISRGDIIRFIDKCIDKHELIEAVASDILDQVIRDKVENVQPGTKIKITKGSMSIVGIVKVVANTPHKDGIVNDMWYWDLEYEILNPLPDHGTYGRWKQRQDGGEMEVLP